MKPNIHPAYAPIKVICSCGQSFETGSTKGQESLRIEICNQCHPFYTGQQRMVDTGGRVKEFERKFGKFNKKKDVSTDQ